MEIGHTLILEKNMMVSPDYDDWTLNGDILFWYPVLEIAPRNVLYGHSGG